MKLRLLSTALWLAASLHKDPKEKGALRHLATEIERADRPLTRTSH